MSGDAQGYNSEKRRKQRIRTIRNISVFAVLMLILVLLFVIKFFIAPSAEIGNMDHIEIYHNDSVYRIDITADNCSYDADGILKWNPSEVKLVMKNGDVQTVLYDGHYDVFMFPDKYSGCYVIDQ